MGRVRQPSQGRGAERGADRAVAGRAWPDRPEGAGLKEDRVAGKALVAGALCYVLWGSSPLLFIALGRAGASPWEIVGQRAAWAAPCAAALAIGLGEGRQVLELFRDPRRLGLLALSAIAIATGWAVFVWAVNHGHNLDAALGYYINPLLNMASGAVMFRERIDRFGWAAIALATVGVGLQAVAVGGLPWIALACAVTFWIYGLIRKQIAAEALAGLTVECVLMAVPALVFLVWLSGHARPLFGRSLPLSLFVATVGPATVLPLALFSWTARRMPLSTMAFIQFISPTIGFFVGLAMGEPLSPLRLISFGFIWAGVAAFVLGAMVRTRFSGVSTSTSTHRAPAR